MPIYFKIWCLLCFFFITLFFHLGQYLFPWCRRVAYSYVLQTRNICRLILVCVTHFLGKDNNGTVIDGLQSVVQAARNAVGSNSLFYDLCLWSFLTFYLPERFRDWPTSKLVVVALWCQSRLGHTAVSESTVQNGIFAHPASNLHSLPSVVLQLPLRRSKLALETGQLKDLPAVLILLVANS